MPPETAAAIYKKAQQIDNRATVIAMSFKMRNDPHLCHQWSDQRCAS